MGSEPLEPPDLPTPGDGGAAPPAPASISSLSLSPSNPPPDPSSPPPELPFHGWGCSGLLGSSSPGASPAPVAAAGVHGDLGAADSCCSLLLSYAEPSATFAACGGGGDAVTGSMAAAGRLVLASAPSSDLLSSSAAGMPGKTTRLLEDKVVVEDVVEEDEDDDAVPAPASATDGSSAVRAARAPSPSTQKLGVEVQEDEPDHDIEDKLEVAFGPGMSEYKQQCLNILLNGGYDVTTMDLNLDGLGDEGF